MEIGGNIKKFRINKGLTQKELANKLGVTVTTIQNYENNRRKPDFTVLDNIAEILGCKLFDLLGVVEPELVTVEPAEHFLEQYILTLGYDITGDPAEGYLAIKTSSGTYEITGSDLQELRSSTKSFVEFKLHEIINRSRKIGK